MGILSNGLAAAALAAGVVAAPAEAAVMQAVFTGIVSSGSDPSGLFGVGATLDGEDFTLTYVYDTSLGGRITLPESDYVFGGDGHALATPTISANLRIGSGSQNVDGTRESSFFVCQAVACSVPMYDTRAVDYMEQPDGSYVFNYVQAAVDDISLSVPDNLDTPFSVSIAALQQFGAFQFLSVDAVTGNVPIYTVGLLTFDRVAVTEVGATPVPLPAAFPLLAGALGLLALLFRRRRAA